MTREHEIAFVDVGPPKFADQCGLGDRFRYWQGGSGRRYLFTAMPGAEIGDVASAVVILAKRAGNGGFQGIDVCAPGDPGEPRAADLLADLTADPELLAFVHLLADDIGERRAIIGDFVGREHRLAA